MPIARCSRGLRNRNWCQRSAQLPHSDQQRQIDYPTLDRSDLTLLAQSERACRILHDACQPFADDSAADAALETAVWSLVHGYALLGFGDPIKRTRSFVVAPGFETLLPRLIVQHANPLAPPANLR